MENFPSDWDLKNLVRELSEGRELAKQLQVLLNVQPSSHETQEFLLHRILHSYDQALSMLKYSRPAGAGGGADAPPTGVVLQGTADSPPSLTGSPHSDDSDQDFKDQPSGSRKSCRKSTPSWSKKVRVCTGTGLESQLDDGYNWRKYGQKDILGAKHPRGYYRCSYRHAQGCMATKQVQRSDDDPTIFEITYRRPHTCCQRANSSNNNPPITTLDPQNEDPNPLPGSQQNPQPEPPFSIQTSLRVITQGLNPNEDPSFEPFNFLSSSGITNPENNHIFPDSNNLLGDNYSPNLLSPATSGSNYFPISSNIMNDNYGELIPNLHINLESELSPIVAAVTSATNSPTVGANSPFDSLDFGFGNQGYRYP